MVPVQVQWRLRLKELSRKWIEQGLVSRGALETIAAGISKWKKDNNSESLWQIQPTLLTATLDDGLGQGLDLIECTAAMTGMQVKRLGLLQKPETVVEACHRYQPQLLGLTVLQLDSEEPLAAVGHRLPSGTRLIAGGPAFKFDPQMAQRCGVDYVAPNYAFFLEYLLDWQPS